MLLTLGSALLCVVAPAKAGLLDSIFGGIGDNSASDRRREWSLGEFSHVRLVQSEEGAGLNQHPVSINSDALQLELAGIRSKLRGIQEPLFVSEELVALAPAVKAALEAAGPNQDVIVLSTARHAGGAFLGQDGVTARLFVQENALQLIVHDARFDFVGAVRHTGMTPHFEYGSRRRAGDELIASGTGVSKRSDWIEIPLSNVSGSTARRMADQNAGHPVVRHSPVHGDDASGLAPSPSPARQGTAAALDPEERLATLKRLRDKQLISEEEYQRKRRQILDSL